MMTMKFATGFNMKDKYEYFEAVITPFHTGKELDTVRTARLFIITRSRAARTCVSVKVSSNGFKLIASNTRHVI